MTAPPRVTARETTARPGFAGAWAGVVRRVADLEALLLPQRCPGCGEPAEPASFLCGPCWVRVPRLEVPICVRCLELERDPSACRAHAGFRTWAAFVYEERLARAVHALKFRERYGLAATLGARVARAIPMDYRPDLVLDVPLHPVRLRERGYNQAALLADAVAEHVRAPRLEGGLLRTRPTAAQAGLGAAARRRNLEGAFAAPNPAALRGRNVLVVDDVVTTGSTLSACLATLEACGARASAAALAWAA